ncbi:FmdB family zinc ribbon protein [Dictyobacter formicarum]|nr:zinc ribbon domain-containing protein [Dictyobacter formicarum]
MPRYEFRCEQCGSFEYWRSLADAAAPMYCPVCQREVRRIYTAPGLVRTPPALAQAYYRAEKSTCEPEVIRREPEKPREQPAPPVFHQSHGRPWMLEH